jgi:hypothetical protein
MPVSDTVYDWAGIIGGLFAAVLLIVGIAFALNLLKVARPVPWAVAGVTLVAAGFLVMRGGTVVLVVVFLLGIPLAGGFVNLLVKSPSTRKVAGIMSVCLVGLALLLTLVRSSTLSNFMTRDRPGVISSRYGDLMQAQAERVRDLRQQEDRQRRELFDSREAAAVGSDAPAENSGSVDSLKTSPGVAWYPEVDERFESDVQPSMSAAGRSLGRKLLPLVKHVTSQGTEPEIIQIGGSGNENELIGSEFEKALDALASVMRRRYPDAQVLVEKVSHSQPVTGVSGSLISIRLASSNLQYKNGRSEIESTHLTAYMSGWINTGVTVGVTMVDKPWVNQFDVFLASNRGDDLLIDARSGRLETSQLAARNSAIEVAVNTLAPVAMEVLNAQRQRILRTPDVTEVADRLKTELVGGRLIVDSFSQQLVHPMGNLWREAILVRADYESMQRVISDFVQQQRATERGQLSFAAALVLLVVGIIVLHMILNWITKGYHRKNIGLLSGLLAITGVLMVLILTLNLP